MPIGLKIPRGTMNPPKGATLNPEHPFSKNISFCLPLNEVSTIGSTDGGTGWPQFKSSLLIGGGPSNATATWGRGAASESTYWDSNRAGRCLSFPTIWGIGYLSGALAYMTTQCTIALLRRKKDTTLRINHPITHGVADGQYIYINCPYNDGVVTYYFGLAATPLTVSGIPLTTDVQAWVFTDGPAGPAIYLDGVKIASNSTPRTRTVNFSDNIVIGNGPSQTESDIQEINFFQMSDTQWSDDMVRWWSAEPYAHLYSPVAQRQYFFLGEIAPGASPRSYGFFVQ
jgi:hypothetical protein